MKSSNTNLDWKSLTFNELISLYKNQNSQIAYEMLNRFFHEVLIKVLKAKLCWTNKYKTIETDDLYSIAYFIYQQAIKKFDLNENKEFSKWAYWYLYNRLRDHIRSTNRKKDCLIKALPYKEELMETKLFGETDFISQIQNQYQEEIYSELLFKKCLDLLTNRKSRCAKKDLAIFKLKAEGKSLEQIARELKITSYYIYKKWSLIKEYLVKNIDLEEIKQKSETLAFSNMFN